MIFKTILEVYVNTVVPGDYKGPPDPTDDSKHVFLCRRETIPSSSGEGDVTDRLSVVRVTGMSYYL